MELKKNFKKNEDSISFDLMNKKEVKKTSKNQKRIMNIFLIFMFSQLLLGLSYINNLQNTGKVDYLNSVDTFNNYKNLQDNARSGNQENSLIAFNQVVKGNSAINDSLASGFVLNMLVQDKEKYVSKRDTLEDRLVEENRYKLTEETKSKIIKIYKENFKNGINFEKEKLTRYNCLFFDVSCYALKWQYNKMGNDGLNLIENKLNIYNYNINHIDEYVKWQNTVLKNKENIDMLSPGQLAFPMKKEP